MLARRLVCPCLQLLSRTLVLPSFAALASIGCSIGPTFLESTHQGYNSAVKLTRDEQLLQNIVRLRYYDPPEFLAVNVISAQTSVALSVGGRFGTERGDPSNFGTLGVGFSDRPTITFIPERTKEFMRGFLGPIDGETFAFLISSGWEIDRVLRLTLHSLGGLKNGETEFERIVAGMRELQIGNYLAIGYATRKETVSPPVPVEAVDATELVEAAKAGFQFEPFGDNQYVLTKAVRQIVCWFSPESDDAKEIASDLGLNADLSTVEVRSSSNVGAKPGREYLQIQPRSVKDVLAFLARGVEIPEDHAKRGLADADAQEGLPGLFSVTATSYRPDDSALSVKYRNHWYSISESDVASRKTFLFVIELLKLRLASAESGTRPVLTLPVTQ